MKTFDPLKFETRFVAFVDIIGFEKIVEQIEENQSTSSDQIDRLMSILTLLKGQEDGGSYSNSYLVKESGKMTRKQLGDIRTIAVSDCIIMSAQGDFEGFKELLFRVGSIATDLAIDGWFVRGAITRGNLYHKEAKIFGSAYQRAVRIEKYEAKNPCIVIDKSTSEYLTKCHSNIFPYSSPTIKTRNDGYEYLSYFPYLMYPPYVQTWSHYLKVVRAHIIKNISLNNPETIAKYLWLKEDFNSTVNFFKNCMHKNTGARIIDADVLPI